MSNLKQMFIEALDRNSESLDDVIVISHPIQILNEISTLEEIQCFYLNSAHGHDEIENPVHKQDMPFIAATAHHIYFADIHTIVEDPDNPSGYDENDVWQRQGYIPGVESYSRDDQVVVEVKPLGADIKAVIDAAEEDLKKC